MSGDSSSRRATRLARLIILTVALPSLLLTGLGAMAVANEEAAARKRIEKLYEPVGAALSRRFNGWMKARLSEDDEKLSELAAWADGGGVDPAPEGLLRYLRSSRHAVNHFVIDDGRVLLPARLEEDGEDKRLRKALMVATRFDELPRCGPIRVLMSEGIEEEDMQCAARLALALCENDGETWRYLERSCCGPWTSDPVIGSARGLIDSGRELDARETAEVALTMARELARPDVDRPGWLTTLISRRVAGLFRGDTSVLGLRARRVLQSIATRAQLIRQLVRRNRVFQPQRIASGAVAVGEWRRVVVTRTFAGMLVGYELVPELVSEALEPAVEEKGLDGSIRLEFNPLSAPKWWWGDYAEQARSDIAWWTLLSRTDLAWSMALRLEGTKFWSLSHSRSGLYLWALVLLAAALGGGVGHAVYAVYREGRLSRLKTDFVSSVSHDLRTPLTSIRMFTESLLMNRVKTDGQRREYLEVIAQEAERLSRLTERILDFSRMEAGRKAYVYEEEEVYPLVKHALRSCRPVIDESGGTVSIDVPDELPPVRGDRDALIEVLINLITNAVKYSEDKPEIHLWARAEADAVVLGVTDKGIGIAPPD
ncbi:MAG: HAMP domain-containing sensor histidine kinase, partial [Myxococcota bacterium]